MDTKTIIYELLYDMLIEIRGEAAAIKNPLIFHLSDLFHNTPSQLLLSNNQEDYEELFLWLKNRAKEKGIEKWLENHIQRIIEFRAPIQNEDDE